MESLTVRIAQPPSVNASLSGPGTLYAKSLNYLDFVFSTGVETPNAIVKRDVNGYANFTTARTVAGAAAIYATATGGSGTFAVEASGTNGSGAVAARSVSGVGALLTSGSGIGAQINSNTGSDIASFQNASATIFAVERVNGTLRWIKDSYSARLTPATLTATRTWTLPNTSGTIALTSDIISSAIAATPNTLVLRDATGGSNFADVGASSVTSSGAITTTGDDASIVTTGANAFIATSGSDANIYTSGSNASIVTNGANASIGTNGSDATIFTEGSDAYISTNGANASIITNGANASIYTTGTGAFIQSRSTFKLYNGTYTTTLSHSPTANRAIAFPNASGTLATVVDPVRTTLTGNGSLSAFAISGAGSLSNPSALIVAIDGALQEPTVDYGVSGGVITFTSPLANGAKAVVISPTNTLQVTQMIPADGSVTSTKLANDLTLTNATINGTANFNSTTRPTSSGTGTPAATSLITLTDAVDFITNPNNIIVRDDFINGGSANQTIGDLGWFSFSAGGGTGSSITGPVTVFPNIGARVLTCGNATNAGQVIYLPSITSLLTYAGWEFCFVVKLNQTTDCDLIVGFTKDNGAVGIGKFGGISFGARYSSATDTNFMFYSKNTDLTFATNDASNYAISSGVAVGTTYNTFRIRSIVAGSLEMSINGGSFVSVNTSSITTTGIFIPFFYIATRTTTSKSIDADFFSMKIQGVAR